MGNVFNKSKLVMEKATFKKCPKCKGYGSVKCCLLGYEGVCDICNGYGECWISESGWTRPKHYHNDKSKLY